MPTVMFDLAPALNNWIKETQKNTGKLPTLNEQLAFKEGFESAMEHHRRMFKLAEETRRMFQEVLKETEIESEKLNRISRTKHDRK